MNRSASYQLLFTISIVLVVLVLFTNNVNAIPTRSIREFLTSPNNETLDQLSQVKTALMACSNNSFILQVDCKVFIDISNDVYRPIFIESGTNVQFTPDGLFIVNNMFIPAFVFVNTVNVTFNGWNIKYNGYFVGPTNYGFWKMGDAYTYPVSSVWMSQANFFSDVTLKNYMINSRNIKFVATNPSWSGPAGSGALFSIRGSSQFLNFTNMYIYSNKNGPGNSFVPWCFLFAGGWRSNQTVSTSTSGTFEYFAVPSDINFYNITMDGTVMAFQGNLQRTTFKRIRSYRYTDVQDLAWDQAGGVGKWFPPPHLYYLNYNDGGDYRLFNINLTLSDVIDYGQRVGLSRDKNNGDSVSGDARSLKIGGINVVIDNYISYRPDGFLDLLSSNNLIMRNVKATFDTSFLNYVLVPIRLPSSSYKNIVIDGMEIVDIATKTSMKPFGGFPGSSSNCILRNTKFTLNTYTGSIPSLSGWGSGTNMKINYSCNFVNPSTNTKQVVSVNYIN